MSSPSPITGVVCCVESCYHVPHSLSSFQFSGADVAHLYRAGAITGLCGCNCYYIAAVVTKSNPRMSAVFSRITNVTASPIFYGSSSVFFLFLSGSLLLLSSSSSSSSFVMVFLAHITLHCPYDIFSLTQHIYICVLCLFPRQSPPILSLTHHWIVRDSVCWFIEAHSGLHQRNEEASFSQFCRTYIVQRRTKSAPVGIRFGIGNLSKKWGVSI